MAPVLLIPGNMCDQRLWQPVAKLLKAAGYTVHHAPPLVQTSINAMAEAVKSGMDASVVAIGFSMGAIVAAQLAACAPNKIRALGLVAFNASPDLPERAAVRPRQQSLVRNGQLEAIVADELKPNYLATANRGDTQLLTTVMEMALTLGSETFITQSEALRSRSDLRQSLGGFEMPVLLACGEEDRLCPPEWHRRWADMIGSNAQFSELADAGHLLPLEQPIALADVLIGWLAEVS